MRNCLIMSGPDAPDLDERLGYGGADLMLAAQDLGLNTWWIGGTFSKRAAARVSGATGRIVARRIPEIVLHILFDMFGL